MMKIKKFTATSIPEALSLAKSEMGTDALILGTYRRPGKGRSNSHVEVVAATNRGRRPPKNVDMAAGTEAVTTNKTEIARMRDMNKDTVLELRQIQSRLTDILESLLAPADWLSGDRACQVHRDLLYAGFDPLIVKEQLTKNGMRYDPPIALALENLIKDIQIEDPVEKISVFVGPSGSGKTTTVLKIAKRILIGKGIRPKVMYFGRDECRDRSWLPAQCKRLGVRFKHVSRINKLEKICGKERKVPILIDTPSISTIGDDEIRFIINASRKFENVRIRLVIDASMDLHNICAIVSCLPGASRMGLVLTKLDEATRIGGAVSAAMSARMPLAYVTGGRDIGDGIFVPDANLLSQKILDSVEVSEGY